MGTNFYFAKTKKALKDNITIHIGKRSAAGMYCYNCKITLCGNGEEKIHCHDSIWLNRCPVCRKTQNENKDIIQHACSFSWAIKPDKFGLASEQVGLKIYDEYGQKYKVDDFLNMLTNDCPIRYYDMIGREFC